MSQGASARARDSWTAAALAMVLALAGAAAYSNALRGPFIFDDVASIPENPTIRSPWRVADVLSPPRGGETVTGRPLLNLSFAINWAIGRDDVFGYHVTNIAIHLVSGLLLFGIIRRTLALPSMRQRFGAGATRIAFAAAMMWTLHPLQTESVTYIVQRAESLAGMMMLVTLYCFIRGVRSPWAGAWLAASVLACAMGMAAKEIMVAAPLIVLLYDRTFVAQSFGAALTRRWRFYAPLLSTWIVLAYLIIGAGNRGGSAAAGSAIAPADYARTQLLAIARYLKLSFWPTPLVLDYGTPVVKSFADVWPFALLVAALGWITLLALLRAPKPGFLAAAFFLILAPTSSVVPVSTQTMAEHRMYLPLAAIVVLAAMLLWRVVGTRAAVLVMLLAALALGAATYRRNADYRTALSIWQDTAVKQPSNARAHSAVGVALFDLGRPAEAIEHYDRAIALDPGSARAFNNRGNAYQAVGEHVLAIADYSAAIERRGDDGNVFVNRAVCRYSLGQYDEAWADVRLGRERGAEPHPGFLAALQQASGRQR